MELEHINLVTPIILMEVHLDNDVEVVIVMDGVMVMGTVVDKVMDEDAEITTEDINIHACLNEQFVSFQ